MVGNLVSFIQFVTDLRLHRNESFSFAVSSLTPKVFVWVHEHKTLGKDKEVAEGEVEECFSFVYVFSFSYSSNLDLAPCQARRHFIG